MSIYIFCLPGSKVDDRRSSSSVDQIVPLRKRDSTSEDTPHRKLNKKSRQLSTPVDLYIAPSNNADVVRPTGITVSIIESSVEPDRLEISDNHHSEGSPPPLPERRLKRAASDSALLDKFDDEIGTEHTSSSDSLYQSPHTTANEIRPLATPPPGRTYVRCMEDFGM